jgi:hypothetical protein
MNAGNGAESNSIRGNENASLQNASERHPGRASTGGRLYSRMAEEEIPGLQQVEAVEQRTVKEASENRKW